MISGYEILARAAYAVYADMGNAWAEFVPFLSFDVEIRRVICLTPAQAT